MLLLGLFHRVSVVLGFFVHGSWGSGSVVVNMTFPRSQWCLKDSAHIVGRELFTEKKRKPQISDCAAQHSASFTVKAPVKATSNRTKPVGSRKVGVLSLGVEK
jgi:hypothetical protein